MNFIEDYPFSKLSSLRTTETASFFCELSDIYQIDEIISFSAERNLPILIIGEGTNIVPTKTFQGLVVFNNLLGIKEIDKMIIEVASGENWHDFVKWTIRHKMFGLENLALIPGTVGAGPIQNIGAYGSEISNFIKKITCFDLKTGSIKVLYANECGFGYRTSIFKVCSDYIILSVTFQFETDPKINYSYSSLQKEINKNNINKNNLTHRDIFDLVSKIRKKVLPDYKEFPNVGSFFKNVVLSKEEFSKLDITDEIPVYYEGDDIKISAAFLIEKYGWKGFREGNVGISDQHALVLVTYEETPGDEILKFANKIINQIFSVTGIKLEIEPTLI
ncbi:UDP-N-acetylmuramate dehydrogenase [SAR86 cluster bacterium]|nr:UDP-N-acetylmuramate dehydrogenase [SAR86 cluster bacterium]